VGKRERERACDVTKNKKFRQNPVECHNQDCMELEYSRQKQQHCFQYSLRNLVLLFKTFIQQCE